MDHLLIETSAGKIGFAGRFWTDRARPCLLIVAGAFIDPGQHHEIIDWFPEATVLVANLPGMGGVPWSSADAGQLAAGLGEAPLVVCGVSAGCLAAMPLKAANLRRKVLVEPFLTTQDLWPFVAYARTLLELNPGHKGLRHYLWTLFGVSETAVETRDYRHLVASLDVPTEVVVGGMPLLPERETPHFPSLASPEDRAALAANPQVTLHEGSPGAGHDVWVDPQTNALIRRLLADALESVTEPAAP